MNVSQDNFRILRRGLVPIALLLAATMAVAGLTEHKLQIVLEEKGGKWCPTDVIDTGKSCSSGNEKNVCVGNGDKIEWQSMRSVDGNLEASTDGFELFFDPFVGSPHKGPNGNYSRNVDNTIPGTVSFKYTVVMDDCPDHPLDPHIIVTN